MQPLWQAVWRMCLHKLILFTTPFLKGRGSGEWSEPQLKRSPRKRRVQRGATPLAGARGAVAHSLRQSPNRQEVGQDAARAPIEARPAIAGVQDAAPPQIAQLPLLAMTGWRCGPALRRASGESRGVQPLWQAVWGCASINYRFFTSPFLRKEGGPGGWSEPQLKRSPRKRGVQRGATPLAGVWGCPPGLLIIPPSWKEGGRGMVLAPIEAKPRIAGVQQDAAPPQIASSLHSSQ